MSLILPASARRAAAASPTPTKSVLAGYINNPAQFSAQQREELTAAVGDISDMRVTLNRILLAIWVRPKELQVQGGGSILLPDTAREEDKYQGNCGLVLKMGPAAFVDDENYTFAAEEKTKAGDWVLFRRGDGFRLRINGVDCWMLESEKGIKAIVPYPDMVY